MFAVAIVLVGWAVANREPVMMWLDPLDRSNGSITMPLYLFGFVFLIAGVLIGGTAAWFRQGRWRRSHARLAAEVAALKGDLDLAKRSTVGGDPGSARGARRTAWKLPAA